MASACLEEALDKKGVDVEIICNTVALVYIGILCLSIIPPTLIVSRRNVRHCTCCCRFCEQTILTHS